MEAAEFWDKIKEILAGQDKTFTWLCEQAGVSVQVMKNRVYKQRIPDVNDILKLLSVLNVTVEEFYGVEKQFSLKNMPDLETEDNRIPVFEQVFSCGHGQFVPDMEQVEEYITIPLELRQKKFKGHLAASKIRGDSMEPTIYDGDTVICDSLGYREDGIHAIIYQGKGFVKRLQTVEGGVKIISDNPAYDPMFVTGQDEDQFKVIGKVHYLLHKV